MTRTFKSLSCAESENIILKSRFIGFVYPIADEDDAAEKLAALKKKYYDSTHICYAYIADADGQLAKSSDDGEPSGTAGQPMLDILKKGGYKKTLAAVVRYFGGTKLGVGGLVRAYSDTLQKTIDNSSVLVYNMCDVYLISLSYKAYNGGFSKLRGNGFTVLDADFGNAVKVTVAVESGRNITHDLDEATLGEAKAKYINSEYIKIE